jgi:hypothetical protein
VPLNVPLKPRLLKKPERRSVGHLILPLRLKLARLRFVAAIMSIAVIC